MPHDFLGIGIPINKTYPKEEVSEKNSPENDVLGIGILINLIYHFFMCYCHPKCHICELLLYLFNLKPVESEIKLILQFDIECKAQSRVAK